MSENRLEGMCDEQRAGVLALDDGVFGGGIWLVVNQQPYPHNSPIGAISRLPRRGAPPLRPLWQQGHPLRREQDDHLHRPRRYPGVSRNRQDRCERRAHRLAGGRLGGRAGHRHHQRHQPPVNSHGGLSRFDGGMGEPATLCRLLGTARRPHRAQKARSVFAGQHRQRGRQ